MPRRSVISKTAIINALRRFKGNVAATAKHLHIRRNSLYERINRERIQLSDYSDFRRKRKLHTGHFSAPYATGHLRNPYDPSATGHDRANFAPFTKNPEVSMVRDMKAELDPEADVARNRNLRVPQQLSEGLRWLRLELWKARGVEYDEVALLEHFGNRYFNEYAAALLKASGEDDSDKQHRAKK